VEWVHNEGTNGAGSVEQNALMSPNPRGKLEDLVVVVVCVCV